MSPSRVYDARRVKGTEGTRARATKVEMEERDAPKASHTAHVVGPMKQIGTCSNLLRAGEESDR